ncbi:interferon gamma receptor 1 isoform 2-T2 [Leptodactylus fuscus]|uniref:interferon gamma receptor 1 isoform X2 n=1 Tax=Leptodactylus fuscus TaxID=238119 RepID=UPI003F4F1512
MEAIPSRTVSLLLYVLSVLAVSAVPVQKPFNLKKISYNFNTTLSWDYDVTSVTPYFQVEYKSPRSHSWTTVETCMNTSSNYCDLSEKIVDPYVYYDVRVKAVVGSGMSNYAKTEFYLIEDGIIGPPTINASVDEKFMYIDVGYPDAPHVNGKKNVGDYLDDLTYDIHYGDEMQEMEECDHYGCSTQILITNQTKYCIWAQGKSESVPMTIEKSKEICINTAVKTVQKPFNLKKISYNFNSTLYWDYDVTSVTPYFQVEYRYYSNSWTVVETCVHTSHNYCDLSEKIVDPYVYYDVRVKAFVGSEMSDYAKTEFYLISDCIIGPPTINASVEGKFINVDVEYPDAPRLNGKNNVGDYLDGLMYDIHYGNETKVTEECDNFGCSTQILITGNQTKYCFWAEGKSEIVPITIERSKEICINIAVKTGTLSNNQIAIMVSILVIVIVLLVLTFFVMKRKLEDKPVIPWSLRSFTTGMQHVYRPTDQLSKYDPVSISPVESHVERPDKKLNVSDDSDLGDSIAHGSQSSVGEAEQKADTDQNASEESSGSKNYYRTEDNGDSIGGSVTENEVTEQEPPRDITPPITNSNGYDRPHCLP